MKIRIQGNSMRLRLTQSEVAQFLSSGQVMSKVKFPNQKQMNYGLIKTSDQTINVSFINDAITVQVPINLGDTWASTEQIGFEGSVLIDCGDQLNILIEKDFKCLSRESEDKSDLFPNPLEKNET